MADVSFEHTESLTREQAASWLTVLAHAFRAGGEAELPLGNGRVKLDLPDVLRAEFEIEIDGDEVQVEVELSWSTSPGESENRADG
jgi:amphi-Trp domain-containing protein